MNDLKEKYDGMFLGTDEVAEAHNSIAKAIEELESIKYNAGPDHLLLKWGTLKSWDLHTEEAIAMLKRYHEIGSSMSAMSQKDTPEQKDLICQMIDECKGFIQNDWDGDYYTRKQAKEYVRSYGTDA